jgi:hypothetical protein
MKRDIFDEMVFEKESIWAWDGVGLLRSQETGFFFLLDFFTWLMFSFSRDLVLEWPWALSSTFIELDTNRCVCWVYLGDLLN